ncbi:MAG: hypothetical protein OXL38_21990 [Gammaproteobacteria bacterium]|nr:hypothetical protein [Gammaproteobacteria bacterium]
MSGRRSVFNTGRASVPSPLCARTVVAHFYRSEVPRALCCVSHAQLRRWALSSASGELDLRKFDLAVLPTGHDVVDGLVLRVLGLDLDPLVEVPVAEERDEDLDGN